MILCIKHRHVEKKKKFEHLSVSLAASEGIFGLPAAKKIVPLKLYAKGL